MSKMKLFCFPYAGGSAAIFSSWKRYLHPEIELKPVELAGRGKRMGEPFYNEVSEAIEDVFDKVKNEIDQLPYALFGHSMGCMISYELAQKIREYNLKAPTHLFFSGRKAPHIKTEDEKIYHLMDDIQFKKEVIELGGTPPEFFNNSELLKLFLPLLKNDFRITEHATFSEVIRPFDSNITVFLGKDDDLTAEECHGWRVHTKRLCSIHYFEGGHFFLHEQAKDLLRVINNVMLDNCPNPSSVESDYANNRALH